MKKKNKHIACTVTDCVYNNNECDHCTLNQIKVCSCDCDKTKEATMCDSYDKKEND